MKPELWQQINRLYHSALEREPNQRTAFLDQACAGDESLRREVEGLIVANDQAGSFIESPAYAVAAEMLMNGQDRSLVGASISQYRIIELLGRGGMGEVYLAQDTKLGRDIALKVLPANFTKDEGRVRRFQREARAVSTLNHPNIITIHEIGEVQGKHFLATEYIEGETLRQYISGREMKLPQLLNLAVQAADALASAHEAGITHRDIKPENIMVRRRDGYVKVLDFGLAKLTEQQSAAVDPEGPTKTLLKTEPGVVMGTALYMSPEQGRGLAVDARTDIWSLGVVLYEMVAGRLPFDGSSTSEILASVLGEKDPPPLARYTRGVPAELERIVTKALHKDREDRYQVMKDLALDLKSLKRRLEFEADMERSAAPERGAAATAPAGGAQPPAQTAHNPAASPTSSSEYVVGEIKRHKLGVIAAVAALVMAIAAYAYFFYFSGSGKAPINSVAVLPFVNVSSDQDTEYLSDGISGSLINSLSQLPQLKVIARSSSFKYKGQEVDPQEVARVLGVQALVTGRVVQRAGMLLISVELVDARDKTQMWGEQYNRRAEDLLQVQSEISREIAERLRLRLTTGEQQQLVKSVIVNPQAYELFLKGRFRWNNGGTENAKRAVEYFQQAIAVDPAYAPAYAELSRSYSDLVTGSILDPKEFTPKAEAAARKALELDESLAEAHLASGGIKLYAWDWAGAEREFKRAIELNPNLAAAHAFYSFYLGLVGRPDQANAEIKRARELDPLSPQVNAWVGVQLLLARQYDQAIEALKRSLELDQNNPNATRVLGDVYGAKGMYAEAIATYQQVIKLGGNTPGTQIYLGAAYAKSGEREPAQAILKRLETKTEYVSPGELAVLYVALGERDQAFASLERAYVVHDSQLQSLGVDPFFDPLRSDPRFKDLLRRVGLSP
jgi:serine/threonine-protein kinase